MGKIRVEDAGGVRTVTLARPDKRNALTADMLQALYEAFGAEPGPDARVAVLRAEGPVFCAGLDLRERASSSRGSAGIEQVLHRLERYPLPVVAVVGGDAIAGGNELALHCDLVVASLEARFGMSLSQLGLAPSWFLTKKLVETAGPVAAREILLLGDPLPAARMAALGIIARAVSPVELQGEAAAVIDRLTRNAPLSLRAMKAMLLRQMQFRDGIAHEDVDALVAQASGSADAAEGIRARLERRTPRFDGR